MEMQLLSHWSNLSLTGYNADAKGSVYPNICSSCHSVIGRIDNCHSLIGYNANCDGQKVSVYSIICSSWPELEVTMEGWIERPVNEEITWVCINLFMLQTQTSTQHFEQPTLNNLYR